MAPASPPRPSTSTDSGHGTQALTLLIMVPVAFTATGAGTEHVRVAVAASTADTGAGADALVIHRTEALADSGGETLGYNDGYGDVYDAPAFAVAAAVKDPDTGHAGMALTVANAVTLSQTARGDAILTLAATLGPQHDSGTGTDGLTHIRCITGLSARIRVRTQSAAVRVREPSARVLASVQS